MILRRVKASCHVPPTHQRGRCARRARRGSPSVCEARDFSVMFYSTQDCALTPFAYATLRHFPRFAWEEIVCGATR